MIKGETGMPLDLHIHSHFSDGTNSPAEIVKKAKLQKLTVISITDHDTVSGTAEALEAGGKHGVDVISGIELSVVLDECHMHILGYFIDHKDKKLQDKLSVIQDARKTRNRKIIEKLQQQGIEISYRDVMNISATGLMGRPHIARCLMRKKIVRNIDEAFTKYLKKGASGYVSRFIYTAEEAIKMIRDSGGIAVLAHPFQIDSSLVIITKLVGQLVEYGLDGIEVYYPTHSKKVKKKLKAIAAQYDLALSGGSDYHGQIRPGTNLSGGGNQIVPCEILDKLQEKRVKCQESHNY